MEPLNGSTETSSSSITNWKEFTKAGLTPVEIVCSEYRPVHPSVTGCHSRLQTRIALKGAPINPLTKRATKTGSGQPMLDHTRADHGGGFLVKFKRTALDEATAWKGWKDLEKSGVEITDIRCEWCEKPEDRVHAGSLLSHFRPHKGRGRGLKAADSFWMTLSFNKDLDLSLEEMEDE